EPAARGGGGPRTIRAPAPDGAAPRPPRRPSVPRRAWLLVRDPGRRPDEDLARLGRLQAACPPVATAYPLLQGIVRIVRERAPERLDGWLEAATGSGVPDLVTFAAGLRRERAELLAALTLPWSTRAVQGHVTRLKLIKRQGYGRAGLETLKRRLLRAA